MVYQSYIQNVPRVHKRKRDVVQEQEQEHQDTQKQIQ
jgi:hypothetical protein